MRRFTLALIPLLILSACSESSKCAGPEEVLTELIGTWSFENSGLSETWTIEADYHYRGTVNRSFNGVLEPVQYIDIIIAGDSTSYTGRRIGAHESSPPIEYKLKETSETKLLFENIHGRFPQEIIYQISDKDHFSVTMQGSQNGRSRADTFHYSKAK